MWNANNKGVRTLAAAVVFVLVVLSFGSWLHNSRDLVNEQKSRFLYDPVTLTGLWECLHVCRSFTRTWRAQ